MEVGAGSGRPRVHEEGERVGGVRRGGADHGVPFVGKVFY